MTSKEKGHGKPWGSKTRCPVGWASAVEDKGLSPSLPEVGFCPLCAVYTGKPLYSLPTPASF